MTSIHKTDFSSIYNQPDPRQYFTTLDPLDYQIPQQALPYLKHLIENHKHVSHKVLDLCCSYGINGALLRYNIDYNTLASYYTESNSNSGSRQPFDGTDHKLFRNCRDIDVVGIDTAPNAIDYAVKTGLMTNGWAENLEVDKPSEQLKQALKDVSLIVCTGGVGYIGTNTFRHIMSAVDQPSKVWSICFVLRMYSFEEITSVFDDHELVTEKIPNAVFRQRRFSSIEEREAAVESVKKRGLDPTGFESDGWFYAECYITRPASEARIPLGELFKHIRAQESGIAGCGSFPGGVHGE